MEKLNNDIYDITSMVTDLQKRYIDEESESTLALGTYGYIADMMSLLIQNSIIVTGELGNELSPSKAKFEKNIIAHAIVQNIEDINAVPSKMTCVIGVFEEDIEKYMVNNKFTLDRDISFYIENFEFHLEYDIIITKTLIANNEVVYSGRYDISRKNALSDITNPYLNAPFIQLYNGKRMVYFIARVMQVTHTTVYKKIITNSLIENKTFQFKFSDQLAGFEVVVTESGETTYLTPVFEGSGISQDIKDFCYYTYVDATHIRVRFDSISYVPKINADIEVRIRTTKGAVGNFKYDKTIYPLITSDRFKYKNLPISLSFADVESYGGEDRKSVSELRKMLPKESLSRGSVTCWQDLENYFNMLNTDENRLIIRKRVDNQFERSFYAFMLLKDSNGNVVPTNTFDIDISKNQFTIIGNRKHTLKPGSFIYYENDMGRVLLPSEEDDKVILDKLLEDDKSNFLYTVPFMMVVTGDPLYVSYYMPFVNQVQYLDFTYINTDATLQFICANIRWSRSYLTNPNEYIMKFTFSQNVSYDKKLIVTDENGKVIENNIKVIVAYYNSDDINLPYRYTVGELIEDESSNNYIYSYTTKISTNDELDDDANIYIEEAYVPSTNSTNHGYFNANVQCKIYICAKLPEGEFGRYDLDTIVPGLDGYTVCNMYTVNGGINLYENYSEIISSQVKDITMETKYSDVDGFHITSVPCIRYSYVNNEESMDEFIENINYKKAYIEQALTLLENNFSIDFKFFNTYGPSKMYSLDKYGDNPIDRVNLTINFEVKLLQSSDKNTKDYIISDIKDIIEDLNDISSLHIPNLITTITNKYRELIEYIEFKGFNSYGPGIQHLYRNENEDAKQIPEFLTVHTNNDRTPDINIQLA